ncbi:MAG TPA: SPOR domain-containing protein [Turneriella sp.]|nr:SPOR domain-containing protein [Turneriella sp.]HNA78735.1 SPOR domain-containing protein [Turneriella sp.]HNE20197.1 SPOR domain-containing protein [Turneriella sp.]HNJ66002.1 SPOR domain-containing protein [Turneriella sp.]HNL11276.1 SPOR domain-containing protein [Turneriella sp.]
MKEFYVLNLDYRRIAIIAGGALVALGLTLFVGMAIGKGQGERQALKLAAEADAQKMGLVPEPQKHSAEHAEKVVVAQGPAAGPIAEKAETAPAGEVPLREDPLVQGPPKKKIQKTSAAKAEAEESDAPRRVKRKSKKAIAKAEPEVSGKVDHNAGGRYTIQVAAFKRAGEAQGLIAKLKEEGIKAQTEKSGAYYLVTVGRSKSKEKLSKALARLKELEYDAYIRKIHKTSEET